MKVVTTIADLRAVRAELPQPVGFVPTMGYLHDGHLALVRAARAESATVVASIFVNPTQFGTDEDLAAYPRDLERDLALLEEESVDMAFVPPVEEMYAKGVGTVVDPQGIGEVLEGAARPGHFRGVATVVVKLFNLVQPQKAYFGEKDAQQVAVLRKVVADLFLPVQLVSCPTVREPDGLALSSRNVYLTEEQRRAATALYRGLSRAREAWVGGEREATTLRAMVTSEVEQEPVIQLEYVSVAHPTTLEGLDTVGVDGALLSLAARAGRARLIDNVRLEGEMEGRS